YYGFCGDETMFKDAPPGSDFLASICVDWEKEAGRASEAGVRVVTPRFATVLGKGGGALAKMLPVFRLGLGGPLGHGRQWFPWIHIHDLSRAILFLIEHNEISGPMNFSAPQTVRNREFTKILAKTLHRPAILPVPAFLIKLVLGELSSVFLEGCKVRPDVLTRHGFAFQFDGLESALTDLVG
ncbi:MAG: TIGR01777 family oxidoreductase, partial [Proteobacteria bacterium]|nr:TIGR01777 family oxidoreductase [Pseudomonadota bacterium]